MKTVAAVLKHARSQARELTATDLVVMHREDLKDLLEQTARNAFSAGQAAGPAKEKKKSRKQAVNVPDEDEDWWQGKV